VNSASAIPELGLIFSAFAYPYALFQVFGGWLGDKWGARLTLFLCGTIWAAATILTGLAGGLASLFAIRFMLGFGEGATFPTATRAMQNWVARDIGRSGRSRWTSRRNMLGRVQG
jgi:MFS family permease